MKTTTIDFVDNATTKEAWNLALWLVGMRLTQRL